MSSHPNDFKVGLFVVCAALVLLGGLFVFGGSKLFESKTHEETYVQEGVAGLTVGAPVLLRGVPVGEVTRINFSWNIYHQIEPRYVVVDFEVGTKVAMVPPGPGFAERVQKEVDKGLRALVKSQGLAGATVLSLEYVKDPAQYPPLRVPWKPRFIYIPSAPAQLSQIMASLDSIATHLKTVDFQALGAQAQKDLAGVQHVVEHVDEINLPGLSSNLTALVTDLRGVANGLQDFVGNTNQLAGRGLPQISADAEELLVQLRPAAAKLEQTLQHVNQLAGNVDESSLNQTLENLRRSSAELEQAIHNFKQYPSGVLFGRPPPPAQSVERPRR
jgi:phospholipid/cholesterol/gamma-HCH transport system substrate-binding protein